MDDNLRTELSRAARDRDAAEGEADQLRGLYDALTEHLEEVEEHRDELCARLERLESAVREASSQAAKGLDKLNGVDDSRLNDYQAANFGIGVAHFRAALAALETALEGNS